MRNACIATGAIRQVAITDEVKARELLSIHVDQLSGRTGNQLGIAKIKTPHKTIVPSAIIVKCQNGSNAENAEVPSTAIRGNSGSVWRCLL